MRHWKIWSSLLALVAASALPAAGGSVSDDFYNAIRTNNQARLDTLVRNGADVNAKDEHGETPLMYSAATGSLAAMRFLIDKGADVNAQNEFGSTALI